MEKMRIDATLRVDSGKGVARTLRRAGQVPGTAYGGKLEKAFSVAVSRHEMAALLRKPAGNITPFDLAVGDTTYSTIVRDYQVHPVSRVLMHCDFLVLDDEMPVTIDVPVRIEGRSKDQEAGARLVLVRREVAVRCLPGAIPSELVVEVSKMVIGDVIYVDQMDFPDGVKPVFTTRYPVLVLKKARAATDEDDEGGEGEGVADEAGDEAEEEKTE